MIRATELAHILVKEVVDAGDLVVDATVGNGHDTHFLADLVGPTGRVIGFDIQEPAIESARRRLAHLHHVVLMHTGHENMTGVVRDLLEDPSDKSQTERSSRLAAVMFNLGYLPGGSKSVSTRPETTITALDQSLNLLRPGGLVTLVLYPGHAGGAEETSAVRAHAENLGPGFSIAHYHRIKSRKPAPELLAIERQTGVGRSSIGSSTNPLPYRPD